MAVDLKQGNDTFGHSVAQPDGAKVQELMTEEELVVFLRIPEISKAKNYASVIENLKRMHNLPCIHLCRKPRYPVKAIEKWIDEQCEKAKK